MSAPTAEDLMIEARRLFSLAGSKVRESVRLELESDKIYRQAHDVQQRAEEILAR